MKKGTLSTNCNAFARNAVTKNRDGALTTFCNPETQVGQTIGSYGLSFPTSTLSDA